MSSGQRFSFDVSDRCLGVCWDDNILGSTCRRCPPFPGDSSFCEFDSIAKDLQKFQSQEPLIADVGHKNRDVKVLSFEVNIHSSLAENIDVGVIS